MTPISGPLNTTFGARTPSPASRLSQTNEAAIYDVSSPSTPDAFGQFKTIPNQEQVEVTKFPIHHKSKALYAAAMVEHAIFTLDARPPFLLQSDNLEEAKYVFMAAMLFTNHTPQIVDIQSNKPEIQAALDAFKANYLTTPEYEAFKNNQALTDFMTARQSDFTPPDKGNESNFNLGM